MDFGITPKLDYVGMSHILPHPLLVWHDKGLLTVIKLTKYRLWFPANELGTSPRWDKNLFAAGLLLEIIYHILVGIARWA